MTAPINQPQIDAIIRYAVTLNKNGWTTAAYHFCRVLAQNGVTPNRQDVLRIYKDYAKLDPQRDDTGPHKVNALMMDDTRVFSSLHLTHHLTAYQKRLAFKSAVDYIDIETSSQCNRQCPYCPNVKYDRRQNNHFLDNEDFSRIIEDLAGIDYDRRISLVGLNEPLMHKEDLYARLRLVREKLPNCTIEQFTNGDYLDRETLQQLENLRINHLKISAHATPGKPYDERDTLKRVLDLSHTLGLKPELSDFQREKRITFELRGSPIQVTYLMENYMTEGHNRAGALPGVGKEAHQRTAPCLLPYEQFIVNYHGDVLPCCIATGDNEVAQKTYVGNIHENSIFDIYAGEKMTAWRRSTMTEGAKHTPCDTCPEMWPGFPPNWEATYAKARRIADAVAREEMQPVPEQAAQ